MRIIAIVLSLLLQACGEEKKLEDASVSSPTEVVPTETRYPEGSQPGGGCLSDCSPLESLRFDFGPDISLALIDCKVLDYQAFPLAGKYQLILRANCLQGIQVYSVSYDLNGTLLTTPTVLSAPCASSFKDIKGFVAASIGTEIGVAYSCLTSSTLAKTWFSKVGETPVVIESFTPSYVDSDYDLKAAWNDEAQILAVASKRGLIRLNGQGVQLGGMVNLNLSKPIQSLSHVAGQWFVISRESYAYVGTRSYCSKVLSNGQVACDKKEFGGPWTRIASNNLVLQGVTSYTSSVSFAISAFNPETCSIGPAQDMGSQVQSNFELQNAGYFKTGIGWALSSSDGSNPGLTLNLYELHLAGKIQSTLAVADGDLSHAQAIPKGNGLAVFYLDSFGNVHLRKGDL
ncbi:MAG: hypothetical protein EOP10_01640 [Proteobacteria bacterium]|nr:MAG: hypothetical protein EOP10_01640 [Pseudomonadota bacterium]